MGVQVPPRTPSQDDGSPRRAWGFRDFGTPPVLPRSVPPMSDTRRPRYLTSSVLLPPMTLGEVLAFAAWVLAVQIIAPRLGLGPALWPTLAVADVAVWFLLVPRRAEATRRRTAIA